MVSHKSLKVLFKRQKYYSDFTDYLKGSYRVCAGANIIYDVSINLSTQHNSELFDVSSLFSYI